MSTRELKICTGRAMRALAFAFALPSGVTDAGELPTVHTGGSVFLYAAIDEGPGRASFDAAGNLYVGNTNVDGAPGGDVMIFRIDAADSSVTTCGPLIPDPDVAYVDRAEILGEPGGILVGSLVAEPEVGRITRVADDCASAGVVASGGCLENVSVMAQDELDRLFVANHSRNNVCVFDDGVWSEFLAPVGSTPGLAVDGSDVYVSWGDCVRKFTLNGVVADSMFALGGVHGVGPPGVFEGVIVSRPDSLFAVNPVTKEETLLLSGPASGGTVAFSPSGDLYLVQRLEHRVLHVTAGGGPVSVAQPLDHAEPWLGRATPNPVGSAGTTIQFSLTTAADVRLIVFDVAGRAVRRLVEGRKLAGQHAVEWNGRDGRGRDVSPGTCFYGLEVGGEIHSRRVVRSR